jgi:KDO2-lipid IV(A) lauroyltransferase
VQIRGLEHLNRSIAGGRGTLLCAYHLGSYSLIPFALVSRGYPITLLTGVQDASNASIERRLAELSEASYRWPLEVVSGALAPRRLLERLRRGGTVLIFADAGLPGTGRVEVAFLGRPLQLPRGIGWLSARSRAPVLPVALLSEPDGRHHLIINAEIAPGDAAPELEVHRILERLVRARPGQWCKWKDW